jgi:hypothetical protein
MFDSLVARVELELSEMMNQVPGLPAFSDVRGVIVPGLELGLPSQAEGLLDIAVRNGVPAVVRYDLKSIVLGIVDLVVSLHAGFVGAVVALAGLWELSDSRERLKPAQCVLVSALAQSGDLRVQELEAGFLRDYSAIMGRSPLMGEFAAELTELERRELIDVSGGWVSLRETCFVSVRE